MVLQHREYIESLDLSALKSMTIGSAVVTPELLDAVERALPGVTSSESYGLTEGGSPFRAPIDGRPVPRGSAGVLAPEIEVGSSTPNGEEHADVGELLIRSPYVCLGYHKQPEITRQKLQDGWLRTGDVFCKDKEGFYYFRSPGRRHVQLRWREHLPEGSREPAVLASGRGQRGRRARAARGKGLRAGRHGRAAHGREGQRRRI